MATHWKFYRGGPTKAAAEVTNVSIDARHVIALNRRAMKLLEGAEAVVLMFEEQNSIIGIVPTNKLNPEGFPVLQKHPCTWIIYAAPFCRHFRISVDRTERFDDPRLDDEGVLRLDLKHTHNVSLRKRRAKAA